MGIGALLAGVNEDGRLVFAGKVGTGFSDKTLRELHKRLRALEQDTCPFAPPPTGLGTPHWVEPSLVAQVTFGEWTADGRMRHPSFQGLREDKPAEEVVREMPPAEPPDASRPPRQRRTREAPRGRRRASAPTRRPRWPACGSPMPTASCTRRRASPSAISPSSTSRSPSGSCPTSRAARRPSCAVPRAWTKECFYQKHVGFGVPDAIRRVKIREKSKVGDYLVVDALPALVSLVQIGILEIHTWNSVVDRLERPDRVVFDLDPAPDVPWPRVVAAARLVRQGLEGLGLESFVKTTGGKGLHVVVPLASGITWERGRRVLARGGGGPRARGSPRLRRHHVQGRPDGQDLRRPLPEHAGRHQRGRLLDARPARGAGLRAARLGRAVAARSRPITTPSPISRAVSRASGRIPGRATGPSARRCPPPADRRPPR